MTRLRPFGLSRRYSPCTRRSGHAQDPRDGRRSLACGLTPGFRTAGEAARNMQLVADPPQTGRFVMAPAGPPTPPEPPARQTERRSGTASTTRRSRADPPVRQPWTPGAQPNPNPPIRLRQLGSRVQWRPNVRQKLPGIHYLRHRERSEATAGRVGGVPWWSRRRVGARPSADRVRGAGATGASTAELVASRRP